MEHVPGRVFKDIMLQGMTPEQRTQIYRAMNDVLVKIHQVNISEAGLDDYGKKGEENELCIVLRLAGPTFG